VVKVQFETQLCGILSHSPPQLLGPQRYVPHYSMSLDVCYSTTSYTSTLLLAFSDSVWCIMCAIDFFMIIISECRTLTLPSQFNILTRVLRQIDLVRAVLNPLTPNDLYRRRAVSPLKIPL
jgi:hypothetical protein